MYEFREELLSAYLDGELTPEQRAEVDRLLERSVAARETLEDYRAIRGLLRDAFTVQQCPSLESAAWTQTTRQPRSRGTRFAALLTTAASLAAAVGLVTRHAQPERTPTGPIVAATDRHESAAKRFEKNAGFENEPRLASNAVTPRQQFKPPPASDELDAGDKANSVIHVKDLTSAKIGDIVEGLEQSPGQVAVISLTVVDRHEGLDAVRYLLDANGEGRKLLNTGAAAFETRIIEVPPENLVAALERIDRGATFHAMPLAQARQLIAAQSNAFASEAQLPRPADTEALPKKGASMLLVDGKAARAQAAQADAATAAELKRQRHPAPRAARQTAADSNVTNKYRKAAAGAPPSADGARRTVRVLVLIRRKPEAKTAPAEKPPRSSS